MDPADDSLNAMLRRCHRITLISLLLCALASALARGSNLSVDAPPMAFTLAALSAALVAIICRRLSTSKRIAPETRAGLAMTGLAAAGLIGVTGLLLAWRLGDKENALLFGVGAVILSLRPPVTIPTEPHRGP